MKIKRKHFLLVMAIFGLLAFYVAKCNAQQVPNTTTFDLDTVVAVVNPTTDDLQDCFNDAIASYFNPTYEGSKNSLLNFRDYGPHNSPIRYVNNGGASESTTGSLTLTYPTGLSSGTGKYLFAFLTHESGTSVLETWPSGWSQKCYYTDGTNDYEILQKTVTGSESGNFSIDISSTGALSYGIILCYENIVSVASAACSSVGVFGGSAGTYAINSYEKEIIFVMLFTDNVISNSSSNFSANVNVSTSTRNGSRIFVGLGEPTSYTVGLSWTTCAAANGRWILSK